MADLTGVDLISLIERDTRLRRVSGRGEWAGPCPWCGGKDRLHCTSTRWFCRQCTPPGPEGYWHDAADYVKKRDGVDFAEACRVLGVGPDGGNGAKAHTRPVHREKPNPTLSPAMEAEGPTYDLGEALLVVEDCQKWLFEDVGTWALAYLESRGIQEDVARAWGLGLNPKAQELRGLWVQRGIVIPGWVGCIPWYVKIRKPAGDRKYVQVEGSKPALYGLDMLQGRSAVVICEGELDAILLHQEAGDLVDVVAIGSKSANPAIPFLGRLIGASRWFVALDADAETEAAKWGEWSERVKRAEPLQGNDVTDFKRAGGDLRRWVTWYLERDTVERLNSRREEPFA